MLVWQALREREALVNRQSYRLELPLSLGLSAMVHKLGRVKNRRKPHGEAVSILCMVNFSLTQKSAASSGHRIFEGSVRSRDVMS